MITEIQLTNLKGHTGAYKLTPVTVICGENRRGKTRILDGLDVGMLSRSPKLGKTNEALFRLASGQYFEVTAPFSPSTGFPSRSAKSTAPPSRWSQVGTSSAPVVARSGSTWVSR